MLYAQLSMKDSGVELHGVPRSALSRVIKEFITRDKVPRNTSWETNIQSHLCVVSQIGEGTGVFDVKGLYSDLTGETTLKQRNLWEEEW